MAENIIALKDIQQPGEVIAPKEEGTYEQYKKDGIYGYRLLPNGRKDKNFAKISYFEGDVYEGNLKHGKYCGEGKYYWKDGSFLEGTFKKNKPMGNGKYTSINGDVYEGNFKKGKYDGQGKYTWADGSFFEGVFKKGRLENGTFTDAEGNVFSCQYKYNRHGVAKGTIIRPIKKTVRESVANEEHKEKTTASKTTKKEQLAKNGLLNKDNTLMTAIRKSQRGAEFKSLYSGAMGIGEQQDKKLMAILDFFSGSNAEQMQRIYKSSVICDKSKSANYISSLVSGTIKASNDFTNSLKASAKSNQASRASNKGAAR